jgi:hypothetical protein
MVYDREPLTNRAPSSFIPATSLADVARFVRAHAARFAAVSAALLVPCFWHDHLEAGDLGSHLYNAWLAQLIRRGQAPGLWLARQWDNVLFDWLLSGFGSLFGLHAAERIAVALAVLIFFWGAFALACAAAQKAPWFIAPVLAAIAYGWTFEMGFFNYYLSIGFAFFGIALFWRGRGWEQWGAFLLAPLAYAAHPLGALWFVAAAAYIGIAEVISRRRNAPLRRTAILRATLFAAAGCALAALHFCLAHQYIMDPPDDPYWMFNGSDQLVLFGPRYKIAAAAVALFVVVSLAMDFRRARRGERERGASSMWAKIGLPVELYALAAIGVVALPDGIHLPRYPAAVALLTQRLTSVSAVLICCVLDAAKPRRWHVIGAWAVALIFFGMLFHDTARISRMETKVEELVRQLPAGSRVMATIVTFPDSRVVIQHIVDRACIGHCFSYGNYEPASEQFRVRANLGNRLVMTNDRDTAAMEEGWYEVRGEDLPACEIYQCGLGLTDLCVRGLEAGEEVDRLGVHPGRTAER